MAREFHGFRCPIVYNEVKPWKYWQVEMHGVM